MALLLRLNARVAATAAARSSRTLTVRSHTIAVRPATTLLCRRPFSTPAAAVASAATPSAAAAGAAPIVDEEPINPEEYARRQGFSDDADDIDESAGGEHAYRADDADPARTVLRLRLLEASLPLVLEKGWTLEALRTAAANLGLSTAAIGIIGPDAPAALVYHAMDKAQQNMRDKFAERIKAGDLTSTSSKLEFCVRTRLSGLVPYLSVWPAGLALVSQPHLAATSLSKAAESADDIWHLCGDKTTDSQWYVKRALLSGVSLSTELFLLTDRSPGQAATWQFLSRQLAGARQLADVPASLGSAANYACNLTTILWQRFGPPAAASAASASNRR